MSRKTPRFDPSQMLKPPSADIAYLLDTATEEVAELAREHGLPLHNLPPETVARDPEQPRRLPSPHELAAMAQAGDNTAVTLLAGLHELGASMREHGQIQPVIVYADTDAARPEITHRLLNGQRRWSAAVLVGLPTLWAVEVPKPDPITRLMRQFEENERREDFTDMERAWALATLQKVIADQAGGEVPWSVIEGQMGVSETRRKELIRLMKFDPEGQALIQRHDWGTWVLRPLLQALTSGEIAAADATDMLRVLADAPSVGQDRVQALVNGHVQRGPLRQAVSRHPTSHNEKPLLPRRMERIQRSVELLRTQVMSIRNTEERAAYRAEARALRRSLEALIHELDEPNLT